MIKAKRLGHATFVTPDLDRQIDYYTSVVGLVLIAREPHRACLASPMGQLSIVLEQGSHQRCARLAFEVGGDIDAAGMMAELTRLGLSPRASSDPLPGVSRLVAFEDPKGTIIELFRDWSFLSLPADARGIGALKLGHVAFYCSDPKAMVEFYSRTLGFRLSDWIGDYFAFMRCGPDHHTVNFLRGPVQQMQHIAFELHDASHLTRACDLLGNKRIKILWGPVRHGPGHNVATYHRNADDQIVELFCDLDLIYDEEAGYFEPRPWHRDRPQRPKVWDPKEPRDMWGLPPTPDFLRPSGAPKDAGA